MNSLKEKERENAVNEVRILASLESPYIIGYKESIHDEKLNLLCIVMEYADGGDLQKKIAEAQRQKALIVER
ncbi:MAG: protein kinase [Actinobacteria bacterium]|nr:protein kinase [Actinomycetota bacterium]